MLRISIHQPNFMPWLGYFEKMSQVDIWVHLPDAQFMKGEWQHRQQFRHWQKDKFWLTVPLHQASLHLGTPIREVRIGQYNKGDWRQAHMEDLTRSYGQSYYWLRALPFLDMMYTADWDHLLELNLYTIDWLRVFFKITCPMVDARQVGDWGDLRGSAQLLWLCQSLGATHYLSGPDGRTYLDLPAFERAGIEVEFQDFTHPAYPQVHGEPFVSHLSALDLVVNHQYPNRVLSQRKEA